MLVYALAFIPAVGLPIVAFLNGWLTCYKKDAAHLPFHRRVTLTGYVLLSAVVVLAFFNILFLYQGQTRAVVRADRLESNWQTHNQRLHRSKVRQSALSLMT